MIKITLKNNVIVEADLTDAVNLLKKLAETEQTKVKIPAYKIIKEITKKICKHCGTAITTDSAGRINGNHKYCSPKCKILSNRKRSTRYYWKHRDEIRRKINEAKAKEAITQNNPTIQL